MSESAGRPTLEDRLDWTIQDNAKKAIRIADLERELADCRAELARKTEECAHFRLEYEQHKNAMVSAARLTSHAEREGTKKYQHPGCDVCACPPGVCQADFPEVEPNEPAPSPAGPDALADTSDEERVRDLAQRMIGRWNGPREMLLGFLRLLLRSRPAQGVIPKVYQACARHQHLPIMIAASSMIAPIPVCPHCEADAAMSQQEGK